MTATTRLLAALLLMLLAGCTRFRMHPLPAPEQAPVSLGAVRVTPATTGMMVVLRNVEITADSVTGWQRDAPGALGMRGPSRRVAVHRSQVLVYEPAEYDGWTTTVRVALGVIVAYALAALYVASQSY